MEWFIVIVAVAVVGCAVVAASGHLGQFGLPESRPRLAPVAPPGELTADDIAQAQFQVVARGYAMDQVDELLDRLAAQLRDRSWSTRPESGIMEAERLSNRRIHDGSDETSHG